MTPPAAEAPAGAEQGEGGVHVHLVAVGDDPLGLVDENAGVERGWSCSVRATPCRMVRAWSRPMVARRRVPGPAGGSPRRDPGRRGEQVERADDLAAQPHRQGMDSLENRTPGRGNEAGPPLSEAARSATATGCPLRKRVRPGPSSVYRSLGCAATDRGAGVLGLVPG